MHFLSKEQHHFYWDNTNKPILTVKTGETVVFETLDSCNGRVRSVEQYMAYRASGVLSNPLTGPVAIEGAEPGHTLVVNIQKIELDDSGFQLIGPDRAIVKDEYTDWTCYEVRIERGEIVLPCGIRLPASPIIGSLGVAPGGEPTKPAGRCGGNLDVPEIRAGTRMYIPIESPGALFSLGDLHARQGDGEVVGAPEIGGKVSVQFDLIKDAFCDWCMVEDDTDWHTICPGPSEYEAIRAGTFHNAKFIAREHGIDAKDALILLTMTTRLKCSRTFGWGDNPAVICCSFPKQIVRQATVQERKASPLEVEGG